ENCESLEWLENQTGIDKARLNTLLEKPLEERPTAQEAIDLAKITGTYLHPKYTFLWHDLSISDLLNLRKWLKTNWNRETGIIEGSADQSIKKILERAGISHKVSGNRISIKFFSAILIELLQLSHKTWEFDKSSLPKEPSALDLINTLSDIKVRWKAPVRTGCRMGRPEKARERKMKPPVHLLFPVGSGAGRKRDLIAITKEGSKTITEINYRVCPKCKQFTFRSSCYSCNVETTQIYVCPRGHESTNPVCDYCSELCVTYKKWAVSLQDEYYIASQRIGRSPTEIKGVIKLMNKNRQPEAIEKGILRAYHNIYTFKDGTTRFDMTDAPLTHFRPYEIGVSVQRLRELGYTSDIHGNPLEERDQVLEIFPQDIIVNEEALTYLVRVAKFVDDELARLYKLEPYYSVTWPKDLIGHLVIGLAPHTSTGIVGRIIGLTKAKVCWTHPYWHAAKRRNCLAGTEELLLWDTENHKLIVKPIGEIVEEAIHLGAMQEVVDDFGTTAIQNPYPYWQVISIDPNTRELVFQPIKHWIKGKSNQWIQIRTKKGRTIKMTTDHRALIWYPQKDKIRKVKAVNLNPNNYIPVVTQLNLPIQQPSSKINILQELADNLPDTPKFQTFKHQVRLRNADKWMKQSLKNYFKRLNPKKARITLKMIRELLPTYLGDKLPSEPYKKPFSTDWYNSIPLSHLQVLQQKEVFDWDDIPENAFLGMARDDLIVAPYIPFTTDLMRLLGYFISEGYIRDKYGCYQTNFSLPNPDLRKHVGLLIDQILGSVPYHKADNNQLIHSGRIHAYLFAYAWGIGTRALNKRIPSFIYTLPKNYRIHFLSALIDGDGTIIPSANRITLYTGHKNLAHDYCLLLSTLGVFARLHEGRGDRYGQKILERYKDLGVKPKTGTFLYYVNIPGKENKPLLGKLFLKHKEKREKFEKFSEAVLPSKSDLKNIGKQLISDRIKKVEVLNENASSYCLEVAPTDQKAHHNIVISNFLATGQCDGDEDSVFLLLDGLLNFSRSFLPDRIGGLMDAPLVLNVVLNPAEVDSEAFNVDTSWKYPLELYEASWRGDAPNKLSFIDIVERRLGDVSQYEGFGFTHDTQHIEAGPEVTLYKILDTMAEKIEAQLHIAQLVKAVDADDLAMRILKSHLLRDMTGCLRAFAAQKFRCIKCNTSYRRIPLVGYCRKCGGKIVLTVAPGSVLKYFNLARDLVDKYDVPEFTKNRVKLLDLRQKLLLGGKFHQSNLMDFFKKSKK
ncbi:MAG: LAGLIDADG family homing endonuclease, partial [Candidatus Hermodarchaeota archaeon]